MLSADQLLALLWRRRVWFAISYVGVVAAVAVLSYSLPKTYSSSAYLIVNTTKPTTSQYEAQQVSLVDTQTVAELLLTRNAANQAAQSLPFHATGKQIQGLVTIAPVAQTQLVLIQANGTTPWRAQQLANTYAAVFQHQASPTVDFARIGLGEPAPLVTDPSGPHVHLYLLAGVLVGLLFGTGVAVLAERLDRRLRIPDFASEMLGQPILARVPVAPPERGRPLGARRYQDAVAFNEAFRRAFAQLAFVAEGSPPRLLAIVSAAEREGKSTVSIGIATAAGESLGGNVLLVDGDLRRPSLADRLDLPDTGDQGLATFLLRRDDAAHPPTHRVAEGNIDVITAGTSPLNPTTILGLPAFSEFVSSVAQEYRMAVFDTPPLLAGADASLVALRADGAVLVVDQETSHLQSVEWSIDQLQRAGVNLLGIIVNRSAPATVYGYHYGDLPGPGRAASGPRSTRGPSNGDGEPEVSAPIAAE